MNIAKSHDVIDIRLMLLAVAERIPEKNNKINLIVLDLRTDLLLSAQMSGEELVNIEIRDLFNAIFMSYPKNEFLHSLMFSACSAFLHSAENRHQCTGSADLSVHSLQTEEGFRCSARCRWLLRCS